MLSKSALQTSSSMETCRDRAAIEVIHRPVGGVVSRLDSCPCGARLEKPAEQAHGVCNRCRVEAKKPARKRRRDPDFEDVALPGLEDWGTR